MRARTARMAAVAGAGVLAAIGAGAAVGDGAEAAWTWRSGNPPVVSSATVDGQRRLVVTWTAPDGMTYGGSIYLDNDPANATPVSSGKYGTLMYCNNKGTCKGRWRLETNPGTGPFTYTTEPLDAARFPGGTYYMQVEGYNEDPFPSTRYWEWSNIVTLTVPAADTTPPETTITAGPSGATSASTASFTFTSSETPSTFECRLDGGPFSACTSPKEYVGLAPGPHTFDVRAKDGAGNLDQTPASRTWTMDATAPETTITDGPTGTVSASTATFDFTSSEQGSTFECRLDGGSFAPCTPPFSRSGLGAGSHTFEVRATDAAGNADRTPARRTWTIRAAPSASKPKPRPRTKEPPSPGSQVVALATVSNGCGGSGWSAFVTTQNYVGNSSAFVDSNVNPNAKSYTVEFKVACDIHDAGYSGVVISDPLHGGRRVDFRTWSRQQVDAKFLEDMQLLCERQIPAAAKTALANCKATGGNASIGARSRYNFVRRYGCKFFDAAPLEPGRQNKGPRVNSPCGG